MQVKHLLDTLGYLDPDLLILADGDRPPVLALSTRWKMETKCGPKGACWARAECREKEFGPLLFETEQVPEQSECTMVARVHVLVIS